MAKLVDAQDLKSCLQQCKCGFKSRLGHKKKSGSVERERNLPLFFHLALALTLAQIPAYARDQLGRAAFSEMLNIAEGSAKFSLKDRRNFYITARGSAFESASASAFLTSEGDLPKELSAGLTNTLTDISKMLFAMINNLEKKMN